MQWFHLQSVERVSHANLPGELAEIGRDIEAVVLNRAVRWHAEHRVLLNGRRTVVFDRQWVYGDKLITNYHNQLLAKQDDRSYSMGMSKRELKKDHLLDAGMAVMATHGYNGTSIKDIVDAAEVPKGSFYTYFRSKEDFALAALERATEERARQARALLQDRGLPPLERLARYFREFAGNCDAGVSGGCFIGNMCQEMSDSSEVIRLKVRQLLRNSTLSIEDLLEEARLDGSLRSEQSSAVLAEFLFNAWEGTVMRMKASRCREPLEAFLALLPTVVGRVDSAA